MENQQLNFETLYREYYEKLYKVAFRLTGNKQDAEDVLQETYLNAYKAFAKFNGESSLSTWLYRITVNCSYRYLKSRRKLPIVEITTDLGVSEDSFLEQIKSCELVEDEVMTADIREMCLQMFLNCMPKKQRIAFTLKILMQLPITETASIMNLSENAVKINIYRAKQLMRDNMEGRCSLIIPGNPCQCKIWTKYTPDKLKEQVITRFKPPSQTNTNYTTTVLSEMDFLNNLIGLYSNLPEHSSSEDFIKKIRKLISEGTLKILA